MFENKRFYHGTTKKVITAFGTLFNSIKILRENGDEISVPLSYAPTQHFIETLNKANQKPGERINKLLPRISFAFSSPEYDQTRETDTLDILTCVDDSGERWQYQPVPYTYTVTLQIWTKFLEDQYQIVEQILPCFRPDFNVTINDSDSSMGIKQDIAFELLSVDDEDTYESDVIEKRTMITTLTFSAKVFLYPPVEDGVIVKHVIINMQPTLNTEQPVLKEKIQFIVDPFTANADDIFNIIETTTQVTE